mgnify:CR=1 FL=1
MVTIICKRVQILQQPYGPDVVIITSTLPDGCFPYKVAALFEAKVAAGTGPAWVRKNLGGAPGGFPGLGGLGPPGNQSARENVSRAEGVQEKVRCHRFLE